MAPTLLRLLPWPSRPSWMNKLHTFTHGLANFSSCGCHCGLGTQGTPMDKIDKCGYNKAEVFGCIPSSHTYRYLKLRTKVKRVKTQDRCEKMACECDNKMAKCFRKYLPTYNLRLQNFPGVPCYGLWPLR